MSRLMKLLNFFLAGLLLTLVIYGIETARADEGRGHHHGGDVTQSNDMNIQTAGDIATGGVENQISTGGNRSIAVVTPGLGDVDIAGCLGSTQWSLLVGGKQKLVLNQVCMAEFYLKQGRYDLAAQALCNQPEILMEYLTEVSCEIDHDFSPPKIEGKDEFGDGLGDLYDRAAQFDEHYELAQQQEEEIEYLQEEQASLVGRIDELTTLIEQAPVPQQQVQQQKPYTDDHFDAVWSALKGNDENE